MSATRSLYARFREIDRTHGREDVKHRDNDSGSEGETGFGANVQLLCRDLAYLKAKYGWFQRNRTHRDSATSPHPVTTTVCRRRV